jgi:hypothetical protein
VERNKGCGWGVQSLDFAGHWVLALCGIAGVSAGICVLLHASNVNTRHPSLATCIRRRKASRDHLQKDQTWDIASPIPP